LSILRRVHIWPQQIQIAVCYKTGNCRIGKACAHNLLLFRYKEYLPLPAN